MLDSLIADRIGDAIDLTAGERSVLARLEQRPRTLRRGATLVRENDAGSDIYVVLSGMMMSFVLLPDGSRQILRFIFAGDAIGGWSLLYAKAPETVAALTECTVAVVDRSIVAEIIVDHPRLGGYLLAITQMERLALTDRLAALGRTSAKARIAALLLEIHARMRLVDRHLGDTFVLALTQEEIGDATGLTAVHVNRMLKQLEQDGLIVRTNGKMTLLDRAALGRLSNYVNRFASFDLGWLPAPR